MDTLPRWLLLRRWTVLRFAARLSGAGQHYPGLTTFRAELAQANRLAWGRWLVLTLRVTDWPTSLPSETTPLTYFLAPPSRRS